MFWLKKITTSNAANSPTVSPQQDPLAAFTKQVEDRGAEITQRLFHPLKTAVNVMRQSPVQKPAKQDHISNFIGTMLKNRITAKDSGPTYSDMLRSGSYRDYIETPKQRVVPTPELPQPRSIYGARNSSWGRYVDGWNFHAGKPSRELPR